MAEQKFKPGDVVQLKSGGPKMTVTTVDKAYLSNVLSAWVEWFDAKNEPKSNVYAVEALRLYEPPDEGPVVVGARRH
jgi:uncharacterized protein YodC (DUF2158 family)